MTKVFVVQFYPTGVIREGRVIEEKEFTTTVEYDEVDADTECLREEAQKELVFFTAEEAAAAILKNNGYSRRKTITATAHPLLYIVD